MAPTDFGLPKRLPDSSFEYQKLVVVTSGHISIAYYNHFNGDSNQLEKFNGRLS